VCAKKNWFGGCHEEALQTDFYDFTDPAQRKQLADMLFYCHKRELP